jgi:flagellar protein FliS
VNPYEQSLDSEVSNASPLELTLLLYERLIDLLDQAALDRSPYSRALERSGRIIEHLRSTLNWQDGGRIAAQLDRLYEFQLYSLNQARETGDVKHIEAARDIARTLHSGWLAVRDGMVGVQPLTSRETVAGTSGLWI